MGAARVQRRTNHKEFSTIQPEEIRGMRDAPVTQERTPPSCTPRESWRGCIAAAQADQDSHHEEGNQKSPIHPQLTQQWEWNPLHRIDGSRTAIPRFAPA